MYAQCTAWLVSKPGVSDPGGTLTSTGLVHELWLKLESLRSPLLEDQSRFYRCCAEIMRHILVDHARSGLRGKHSGGDKLLVLDDFQCICAQRLAVDAPKPVGSPYPIWHAHGARLGMTYADVEQLRMAVTNNRLLFAMRDATANIWIAEER